MNLIVLLVFNLDFVIPSAARNLLVFALSRTLKRLGFPLIPGPSPKGEGSCFEK